MQDRGHADSTRGLLVIMHVCTAVLDRGMHSDSVSCINRASCVLASKRQRSRLLPSAECALTESQKHDSQTERRHESQQQHQQPERQAACVIVVMSGRHAAVPSQATTNDCPALLLKRTRERERDSSWYRECAAGRRSGARAHTRGGSSCSMTAKSFSLLFFSLSSRD